MSLLRNTTPTRRCNEPLFWSLFAAGGTVTALLAPVLIVTVGFLVPGDQVAFARLQAILTNPLGRVALLGVATLTLFHAAHRTKHLLTELGRHRFAGPIAGVCYGGALAGSVWAGVVASR